MKALLIMLLACAPSAHAVLPVFDLNLFYFSDTMLYSSSNTGTTRTFYDVMVGMPIAGKGRWVLGWNYDSMSFLDNPGTTTKLSVTDMGPKLIYYVDKDRTWLLGLTYNLITKGTYDPGGSSTELRGTSLRVEFGYTPHMTESLLMGAKLNYYKASFNEEVTNQTSLAKTTNGRTVIYPSFAITYRFD